MLGDFERQRTMMGLGFDIMNVNCLSDSQKEILVRTIERHMLDYEPLNLDKEQKELALSNKK